ncbi:MAG: nicotinamide riboside transporter PnuC [Prevotellaceae bacterium]|jgi:nicotinamide mononucleotide transporter|nr:nicotinamide riboside transporter PnuC [Prevotellaceae bacterium]
MSVFEIIAAVFTFLAIVCAVKEKIWTFPLGMVGTGMYFFVFLSQRAYSSMSLQLIFFALNMYGLYKWTHPEKDATKPDNTLAITLLSVNRRILTVVSIVVLTFTLGYVTSNLHLWFPSIVQDETFSNISLEYRSTCVYIDAYIFSASLVAQFLMALKKLENWVIWIAVDTLSAPFYIITIGIPTGILYSAFIVTGITGLIAWNKSRKKLKI